MSTVWVQCGVEAVRGEYSVGTVWVEAVRGEYSVGTVWVEAVWGGYSVGRVWGGGSAG